MTDDIKLTPSQQAALDAVRAKPGMTLDYYAGSFYLNLEIAKALGFLIFNGYINRDPDTGALTVKGHSTKCHYEGCYEGHYCYGYRPAEYVPTDEGGYWIDEDFEWGACPCCEGVNYENCPKCNDPLTLALTVKG